MTREWWDQYFETSFVDPAQYKEEGIMESVIQSEIMA